MRGTHALIHLDNLKNNIIEIKRFIPQGTKLCVAVKANAYGHGAVECAKVAVECGAEYLAIATVDEGIELREAGIKAKLLMLSLCAPEEVALAVKYDITPLVFDEEYISFYEKEACLLNKSDYEVHIAVDTGMGRIGCEPKNAGLIAKTIVSSPHLKLGGICTHFALSDDIAPSSRDFTEEQFKHFMLAVENVKKEGIDPGIRHCANSAATIDHPEFALDMVRPGIIVYGYYAEEISKTYLEKKGTPLLLKPVMTLETILSAIRVFPKGKSVGYGRTWKADEETHIAVLPIGYGDGWVRRFSLNGVQVAVNGKNYPIRGRICMDQCMIDLGKETDAKRWDKAVLFGDSSYGALQTADDIAKKTGTISYEITSCITSRVPRVYCK